MLSVYKKYIWVSGISQGKALKNHSSIIPALLGFKSHCLYPRSAAAFSSFIVELGPVFYTTCAAGFNSRHSMLCAETGHVLLRKTHCLATQCFAFGTRLRTCRLKNGSLNRFLTPPALLGFKSLFIQKKNSDTNFGIAVLLVRETGLEPVRQRHTPLKRACLPIPALALNR